MEKVQAHPTVILDGAHNPQKMEALAQSLRTIYGGQTYTLIVGMLATKDAPPSIARVLPNAHRVIATSPHVFGKPSVKIGKMAELIRTSDPAKIVETAESVSEAIDRTLDGASPDELKQQ